MDKPPGAEKWIVTNLDGSYHKHNRQGGTSTTTTITENVQRAETPPHEQETKITASLRTEAWNKAHEENMVAAEAHIQAIKDQTQAIKDQTDAISDVKFELHEMNTNIKTLTNVITAYLERQMK